MFGQVGYGVQQHAATAATGAAEKGTFMTGVLRKLSVGLCRCNSICMSVELSRGNGVFYQAERLDSNEREGFLDWNDSSNFGCSIRGSLTDFRV